MAFIRGGNTPDNISGTDLLDYLFGGEGDDTLIGLGGDDYIRGDDGNDSIEGGEGEDALFGRDGNDIINGGNGNDTVNGDDGEDFLEGGDGDDIINGGTNTRDPITRQFIGGDTLVGGLGKDTLIGGSGNDILDGGEDDDQLLGGFDNDQLFGGSGNDELFASIGDDSLQGESGNDTLDGSIGDDLVIGDRDFGSGADGDDFILAGDGNDTVRGGGGSDEIAGGNGDDFLDGGDGDYIDFNGNGSISQNEFLFWSTRDIGGNDNIAGGNGNDTIIGGFGNDTISGGGALAGEIDILYGGQLYENGAILSESSLGLAPDSDLFVIGNENGFFYGGGAGTDGSGDRAVIVDFQNGVDKIQVPTTDGLSSVVANGSTFLFVPNGGGIEILAELAGFTDALAADTFVLPTPSLPALNIVQGTDGDDNPLDGTEQNDQIFGLAGNDFINGLGGDDELLGSIGNDTLLGGLGLDILNGGGTEVGEVDFLDGGADSVQDTFVLGDGNASFYIGSGFSLNDRAVILNFEVSVDQIEYNQSSGANLFAFGNDTIIYTNTGDIIGQVIGVTTNELSSDNFVGV